MIPATGCLQQEGDHVCMGPPFVRGVSLMNWLDDEATVTVHLNVSGTVEDFVVSAGPNRTASSETRALPKGVYPYEAEASTGDRDRGHYAVDCFHFSLHVDLDESGLHSAQAVQ